MIVFKDSLEFIASDKSANLEADGNSFVELALEDVQSSDLLSEKLISAIMNDTSGSMSVFLNETLRTWQHSLHMVFEQNPEARLWHFL